MFDTIQQKLLPIARGSTILAAAAMLAATPFSATAQDDYPNRQITIIVGLGAGGGSDSLARLLAANLTDAFGQTVIVENHPGANGTLGTRLVAEAEPDGHTILVATTGSIVISPNLLTAVTYDPRVDLTPITLVGRIGSMVVVPASSPHQTFEDLVEAARANPGTVTYATSGSGGPQHLAAVRFDHMAGTEMLAVHYQGTGPSIPAILGAHVDSLWGGPQALVEHLNAGSIRVLGISTLERVSSYPDVPTIAELGYPGYESTNWYGVFAPPGTPEPIVETLHQAIIAAMETPELQNFLIAAGAEVVGNTPEEFRAIVAEEYNIYAELLEGVEID